MMSKVSFSLADLDQGLLAKRKTFYNVWCSFLYFATFVLAYEADCLNAWQPFNIVFVQTNVFFTSRFFCHSLVVAASTGAYTIDAAAEHIQSKEKQDLNKIFTLK